MDSESNSKRGFDISAEGARNRYPCHSRRFVVVVWFERAPAGTCGSVSQGIDA